MNKVEEEEIMCKDLKILSKGLFRIKSSEICDFYEPPLIQDWTV